MPFRILRNKKVKYRRNQLAIGVDNRRNKKTNYAKKCVIIQAKQRARAQNRKSSQGLANPFGKGTLSSSHFGYTQVRKSLTSREIGNYDTQFDRQT